MPELTRYAVEFRYSDNGQLYASADLLLSEDEVARTKRFFGALLANGYIEVADDTDPKEVDSIVFPVREREPMTFEQFVADLEAGDTLAEYAEELGIEL